MKTIRTEPIRIRYTFEFKRNLRALAKKYRHIREDLQPVIEQLQAGQVLGDQITGSGYTIFKVRIRNQDISKGKRSGYRMIYYLQTPTEVILITIYSKLEQADISVKRIQQILKEFQEASENQ
jgi:mRNA-degrading endonuclease RelE of RelBE toxin-antitoxin system